MRGGGGVEGGRVVGGGGVGEGGEGEGGEGEGGGVNIVFDRKKNIKGTINNCPPTPPPTPPIVFI